VLTVNLGGAALEGLWLDRGGGGAKSKEKHGPKEKETVENTKGLPARA